MHIVSSKYVGQGGKLLAWQQSCWKQSQVIAHLSEESVEATNSVCTKSTYLDIHLTSKTKRHTPCSFRSYMPLCRHGNE